MQRDSGLQRRLKLPFLYNFLQDAVGANALRRKVIQDHVRAKAGDKVVDIGCGPAKILRWLPDVDCVGFDVNPDYIAFAQRTHGSKGTFVVGDTKSLWEDSRFRDGEIVMGLGIVHHPG
jgi:ubiquinone/menaquinone biosynthesis C-methylase UbiE